MKKILMFLLLTMVVVTSFSIKFAGGGPMISYIFDDQIAKQLPAPLGNEINSSMLLFGGSGMGRVGRNIFLGGEGFYGESVQKSPYTTTIEYGFFKMATVFDLVNFIGFETGIGIGSYSIQMDRKNTTGNKDIDSFIDGTAPHIVTLKSDSYALSASAGIHLRPVSFFSFFIKADGMFTYSPKGFQFSTGDSLTGDNPNNSIFYTISAGLLFGY